MLLDAIGVVGAGGDTLLIDTVAGVRVAYGIDGRRSIGEKGAYAILGGALGLDAGVATTLASRVAAHLVGALARSTCVIGRAVLSVIEFRATGALVTVGTGGTVRGRGTRAVVCGC